MTPVAHVRAIKHPAAPGLPDKEKVLPVLSVSSGQIIWGLSYLFISMCLQVTTPELMLSLRFLIAFGILNLMLLFGKARISLRSKHWKPLLLFSLVEPVYFYFESYALLHSNSTFTGVVLAASPVVAIFLAMFLMREYPSKKQALFCLLPVAGVVVMTLSGSSLGIVDPLGIFFLLGTCLFSALYKTMNRRVSGEYTPFERTYFMMLACLITFTVSALHSVKWNFHAYVQPLFDPRFLVPVVFLSVFGSVVANLLVNYAAARMPVVKHSSFSSLTTLCSMVAGVVFLKEPMTVSILIGSVLILIGIWEVTRQTTYIGGRKPR